jgi:HAD superfamily hydrolase (TIGR01450 family)
MTISPLMRRYDFVLLDLDGCVWVGADATPRAAEATEALRSAGKRIGYVTNDARHSEEEFVRKLWGLGFKASVHEVITVGGAIQHYLAERAGRIGSAYVIGSQSLVDHVANAGLRIVNRTDLATRADIVVVGGFDGFDYEHLRIATQAVLRGADLLGTARDATFPMPDGLWPGTGAIIAAIEYATGRTAMVLGKPDRAIFDTAVDRLAAADGAVLMVGDRFEGDIVGAAGAGIDGALVLSGSTTREEADQAMADPAEGAVRPVAVAEDLGSLVLGAD